MRRFPAWGLGLVVGLGAAILGFALVSLFAGSAGLGVLWASAVAAGAVAGIAAYAAARQRPPVRPEAPSEIQRGEAR